MLSNSNSAARLFSSDVSAIDYYNRGTLRTRQYGISTVQFLDNSLEGLIAGLYLIYIPLREIRNPPTEDINIGILGKLIEHQDDG